MGLSSQVVHLTGLYLDEKMNQIRRIGQISVVEEQV